MISFVDLAWQRLSVLGMFGFARLGGGRRGDGHCGGAFAETLVVVLGKRVDYAHHEVGHHHKDQFLKHPRQQVAAVLQKKARLRVQYIGVQC